MNELSTNRRTLLKSVTALVAGPALGSIAPRVWAQDVLTATTLDAALVKIIASGVTAPEGPAVLPDGSVSMVEFSLGNVVRVHMDGSKDLLASPGSGVAGTLMGKDGALYVAKLNTSAFMRRINAQQGVGMAAAPPADAAPGMDAGMGAGGMKQDGTPSAILRIDLNTRQTTTLYTQLNGKELDGPNDLALDEWGDLWVSQPAGNSVLNARTDGSQLKLVLEGVTGVNGITHLINARCTS
jgi:gluconolactonase